MDVKHPETGAVRVGVTAETFKNEENESAEHEHREP